MKTDKKNTGIGIMCIVIGIWLYAALSSFAVQEGEGMKRIVIKEGIVKQDEEIAKALAAEMAFDIEGAYAMGYSPRDVIDFLMKEPHNLPISFYNNRFYMGRKTVLYIIPLSICALFIIAGAGLIVLKGIRWKPEENYRG